VNYHNPAALNLAISLFAKAAARLSVAAHPVEAAGALMFG
jgi:hypothetical protein